MPKRNGIFIHPRDLEKIRASQRETTIKNLVASSKPTGESDEPMEKKFRRAIGKQGHANVAAALRTEEGQKFLRSPDGADLRQFLATSKILDPVRV